MLNYSDLDGSSMQRFLRLNCEKQSRRSKSTEAQVSEDKGDFLFIAIFGLVSFFKQVKHASSIFSEGMILGVGTICTGLDGRWGGVGEL